VQSKLPFFGRCSLLIAHCSLVFGYSDHYRSIPYRAACQILFVVPSSSRLSSQNNSWTDFSKMRARCVQDACKTRARRVHDACKTLARKAGTRSGSLPLGIPAALKQSV